MRPDVKAAIARLREANGPGGRTQADVLLVCAEVERLDPHADENRPCGECCAQEAHAAGTCCCAQPCPCADLCPTCGKPECGCPLEP